MYICLTYKPVLKVKQIVQREIHKIKIYLRLSIFYALNLGKFIMRYMTLALNFKNLVFINFPVYTKEREIISSNE